MKFSRSRGLRLAALSAVGVLATVGLTCAPAMAERTIYLGGYMPDVVLSAHLGPDSAGKSRSFHAYTDGDTGLTVVFDVAKLAGVATVQFPKSCATTGTTTTCAGHSGELSTDLALVFRAATGAAADASGSFDYTVSAPGATSSRGSTKVGLGHGVDLVTQEKGLTASAKLGETVPFPVSFTNQGDVAAQGIDLFLDADVPTGPVNIPSNCTAAWDHPLGISTALVCHFDETVEAGGSYATNKPFELRVTPTAFAPSSYYSEYVLYPAGQIPDDLLGSARTGTRGTAPKLTLVRQRESRALGADLDQMDNWRDMNITVTSVNPTDPAALGSAVFGEVGATVTATVGVRNLGPAVVRTNRSGDTPVWVRFVVPAGTQVVTVPEGCTAVVDGQDSKPTPGAAAYRCGVSVVDVGGSKVFAFGVRITQKIPSATGAVTLFQYNGDPDPNHSTVFGDANLANNTAQVVVNGPTAAPSASPTTPPLPETGVQTGLIAGAGAAVLGLGAVLLLLARRRRIVTLAE